VLRKVIGSPLRRRRSGTAGFGENGMTGPKGKDSINSMIEGEIIPRLLLAHSGNPDPVAINRRKEIPDTQAGRFATLPLELEVFELLEEVDRYIADGVSVEAIYIDLLAPTARRLGEMWETDECDFIDVTMGLWRLQEVMREIAARTPGVAAAIGAPRSVLVATMPGDQHTFGAQMLDEVFARAGWRSELLSQPQRRELLDRISHQPFDVLTLTISRDCPSSAIASLIKALRGVSANPDLAILIGGRSVNNNPALVADVGADGTGETARSALEMAEKLVLAAPDRAQALR
jgi:methanogenic corrinoid protein MtbC1